MFKKAEGLKKRLELAQNMRDDLLNRMNELELRDDPCSMACLRTYKKIYEGRVKKVDELSSLIGRG
jgi:hypothetical protein